MGHSIRDLELYMQVVLAAELIRKEPKYAERHLVEGNP